MRFSPAPSAASASLRGLAGLPGPGTTGRWLQRWRPSLVPGAVASLAAFVVGTAAAAAARVTDEEIGAWAVTVGGFVTSDAGGKVSQTIEAAGLPTGKYSIISLAFSTLEKVSEADLAKVGQLKRLGYLEFKDATGLTPAGLAGACQAPALGTLLLHKVPLADADLACLGRVKSLRVLHVRGAPQLTGTVWRQWKGFGVTHLALGGWSCAPDTLPALADLKSITSLTLDGVAGLSGDDFAKGPKFTVGEVDVANMPSLHGQLRPVLAAFPRAASVRLTNFQPDSSDVAALAQFKPMAFLQLAGTGTGDPQVPGLAATTSLVTLHWFHFATAGHDLDRLAAAKSLRHLALTDGQLTDDGLRKVATLPQIETLLLDGTAGITDDGVGALSTMKQLRTLRLNRTPVTGLALTRLAALRRLESLDLTGCSAVTPEAVAAFRKALPKCKVVFP